MGLLKLDGENRGMADSVAVFPSDTKADKPLTRPSRWGYELPKA
jgi:hypothetical protein